MKTIRAFAAKHPVPFYYALTFAISWGGFLLVGGQGLFAGTAWATDPRFPAAVLAMLAGPPVAGLASTALVSGAAGLRELLARLLRWRVAGRWYAAALLTAPVLHAAVLFALARFSPVFLPSIVTAGDRTGLLVSGVAVGIAGGLAEELGWTGFVIPRLRAGRGVFANGLIVGVLWGVWHLLQMGWVGASSAEAIPPALFMPAYVVSAIATLTAYRILMVWVYQKTESLLVAVLMHASYIFTTLFVLAPPTTGASFLVYSAVFVATLWTVVALVAVVRARRSSGA